MIQSILEESDGYEDDIMDNFNKQYEQEKKDQRDSNKRAYTAKMQKEQQHAKISPPKFDDVNSDEDFNQTPNLKQYGAYEDKSTGKQFTNNNTTPKSMRNLEQFKSEFALPAKDIES